MSVCKEDTEKKSCTKTSSFSPLISSFPFGCAQVRWGERKKKKKRKSSLSISFLIHTCAMGYLWPRDENRTRKVRIRIVQLGEGGIQRSLKLTFAWVFRVHPSFRNHGNNFPFSSSMHHAKSVKCSYVKDPILRWYTITKSLVTCSTAFVAT